jgi:hypothetical protein
MLKVLACFLVSAALAGCGGYSRQQHLDGSYWLIAVDGAENMTLIRRFGENWVGDKLPGPTVFAAGSNQRYVTIARHPMALGSAPDRRVTEYYYVIRGGDDEPLHDGDVVGPLTKAQFDVAKDRLQLPAFSRTIDELR